MDRFKVSVTLMVCAESEDEAIEKAECAIDRSDALLALDNPRVALEW